MVEDRWNTVAVPILEWMAVNEPAARREHRIGNEINVDGYRVEQELHRLIAAGYIGEHKEWVQDLDEDGHPHPDDEYVEVTRLHLAERGMRAIGRWPSEDLYDSLLDLLEQQLADDNVDEDTKGRLRDLRKTLTGMGKATVGAILTAWTKQQLGL